MATNPSALPELPDYHAMIAQYDAAIVAMHQNDGLSYGQIARKLGLTRGQVAGRAYRHEDRMILERSRAR